MQYHRVDYQKLRNFCIHAFQGYGFDETQSEQITDVLLDADLSGIESHGIQRLIRYHKEITGGLVQKDAVPEVVFETPLSAVIEGNDAMGQLLGVQAMQMAIDKAKKSGFGMVTVRNSNHYGIAGYYTKMAAQQGLIGLSMTNTEAIMVPTFGKQAMLGTNPIAFAMPAQPTIYSFDAATTVVPRGKLEVYVKRGNGLPLGWAVDEEGHDSDDADRVLKNIIAKTGGGILPLGGCGELTSGYKGYGFAMLCEIATAILSGGKGDDEHISEALCMFQALTAMGIDKSRLWMEDQSTSTWENLKFTLALIQEKTGNTPDTMALVTSEYHLFRAGLFADRLGLNILGVPAATTLLPLKINYFIREAVAVWHFIFIGGNHYA